MEHSSSLEPEVKPVTGESDEDSESDGSDMEDNESDRILELRKMVEQNPYHYETHLQLLKELRSHGDLEKLREAREKMSEIFPLTEELWTEWFNDEMSLACIPDHKKYLQNLFEKALLDYTSVRPWLMYCQFVMDSIESSTGVDAVRKIYERAITAVGIHLTEGSSVWDSYREFEMTLLESYQNLQQDEDSDQADSKIETQISRVDSIFRRQVAVPLLGMESTWQEYEDWISEPISESVKRAYEKAFAKLQKCLPFENSLSTAVSPKLAEYQDYISLELSDCDPARIQCIYERAIKDDCLNAELWQQYTNYLDHQLKLPSVAVSVHARAVRNCTWVFTLWNSYLKALDKNKEDIKKIKDVFQKALGCGFTSSDDYLQLWLTYCESMNRRVTSWEDGNVEAEDLRRTLEDAVQYMDHYFGNDGDNSSLIRRYWAAVEAKLFSNLRKAQELWEAIMKIHGKETHMWLEYTHFLRLHGDVVSCRRAFQRAVQTTVDDPERLFEAFVMFERIEGTFEQLDSAVQRSANQLKKIDSKRSKVTEVDTEKLKENMERDERRKQTKLLKNRTNKKIGKQQKVEEHRRKDVKIKTKKEFVSGDKRTFGQKEEKSSQEEPPLKKTRVEDAAKKSHDEKESMEVEISEEDKNHEHTRSEASLKQTVFLSNLLFAVDEAAIKTRFEEVGEINEVRLVRNLVGRSKGYAYLEFKEQSSVEKALKMDRTLVNGRPMFVSPCVDRSKSQAQPFRYTLSLDKQTVFVTNLPFEATKEEIQDVFQKVGEIKEVRIVTNRAGKPRGYAYVEYLDEASASTAVMNLDGHVMNQRPINVALSKPPARNQNEVHFDSKMDQSKATQPGSRGRARTQLTLLPRSIHTPSSSSTSDASNEKEQTKIPEKQIGSAKMKNDDFRLLLKK